MYNWISVTTKDGDCIFANLIKSSEFKGKQISTIRKDLGLENGDIYTE